MQYDLNQLANHSRFQRLVNALLTARFGEDARLTPLVGADGGADGETAPGNPHMEFQYDATQSNSSNSPFQRPRPGRYVFQAKYHRAGDQRPTDIRATVLREFRDELELNVLSRTDRRDLNYFPDYPAVPARVRSRSGKGGVRTAT